MSEHVLITGGAGFIGRRVARALLDAGKRVRVLDALLEQVHEAGAPPADLDPEAELHVGDVRDADAVDRALVGVDAVIHLAAEVGVGQSMYAVERYVSVNGVGSAVLFERLIARPVRRVVVASSMSVYGEGLYRDAAGGLHDSVIRRIGPGRPGFDPTGPDGSPLSPLPTPEWKRPALASVYALSKYVQERLALTLCATYGFEGVALRLFNAFGPGQALSNPYTGVLAIFASQLLNDRAPLVFEDGLQRRDFVHVDDVARAFLLALDHPDAAGGVFNIASGQDRSILEVAQAAARALGRPELAPEIAGVARAGDIRHCFADVSEARRRLGFVAERDFDEALGELADWVLRQEACDRVREARRELERRGLVA